MKNKFFESSQMSLRSHSKYNKSQDILNTLKNSQLDYKKKESRPIKFPKVNYYIQNELSQKTLEFCNQFWRSKNFPNQGNQIGINNKIYNIVNLLNLSEIEISAWASLLFNIVNNIISLSNLLVFTALESKKLLNTNEEFTRHFNFFEQKAKDYGFKNLYEEFIDWEKLNTSKLNLDIRRVNEIYKEFSFLQKSENESLDYNLIVEEILNKNSKKKKIQAIVKKDLSSISQTPMNYSINENPMFAIPSFKQFNSQINELNTPLQIKNEEDFKNSKINLSIKDSFQPDPQLNDLGSIDFPLSIHNSKLPWLIQDSIVDSIENEGIFKKAQRKTKPNFK